MIPHPIILDLYSGAGGWDEGARMVGLPAVGIEIEHDPCRTAVVAGHLRIRADVATYPTAPFAGKLAGLIASPPCQAWSSAGKRRGELDRARVHALVDAYAAGHDDHRHLGTWADQDSHHAAQPVRWIRDLLPPFVALEQVPPVLPLWKHIARIIRQWGYTAWCGILNAADYGVPQTRQRAFLIASRTGLAMPPEPTHDRHPSDGLFGTRAPWVSMAEALGWDGIDRPARTVCGDRSPRWAYGEGNSYGTGWTLVGNQKPERASGEYQSRPDNEPAQAITTQAGLYQWELRTGNSTKAGTRPGGLARGADHPANTVDGSASQWSFRNSNQANACERRACEPAGTLFFGRQLNDMRFLAGDESRRIAIPEAAVLQSFRPDYPWHGTKTSVFSQIGNAVPPLLAAAVIRPLVDPARLERAA